MCQLMLDGLSACWGRDLAQWDLMEARRGLLDTWLNAVAQQGTDGVRLMAQWNLFASALPLHNARCLPGAAQTCRWWGSGCTSCSSACWGAFVPRNTRTACRARRPSC